MREIKFRQPRLNIRGEFLDWFYWGFIDGGFISPIRHDLDSFQYTGRHDKNGKEIYEGDIFSSRDRIGCVIYQAENGCGFQLDPVCTWIPTDGEVIGNIYENPELLKE